MKAHGDRRKERITSLDAKRWWRKARKYHMGSEDHSDDGGGGGGAGLAGEMTELQ